MCGPQGPLSSAKRRALLDHLPRYRPRSGALQGHQVGIQWSGRKNAESNEESFSLLEYVVGFILLNIQEQNKRVDLSFFLQASHFVLQGQQGAPYLAKGKTSIPAFYPSTLPPLSYARS